MPKWEINNLGPEHVIDTLKTLFDLAGDKIETLVINKDAISVELKEEVQIPITVDILHHIVEKDLEVIEKKDDEDILSYFLRIYRIVLSKALPRFLLLSPQSRILPELEPYIRKTAMYKTIFGMLVFERNELDELSFIICGSSGFGEDPASIQFSAKGYIGYGTDRED